MLDEKANSATRKISEKTNLKFTNDKARREIVLPTHVAKYLMNFCGKEILYFYLSTVFVR